MVELRSDEPNATGTAVPTHPSDFRYTPLATKAARRCNMSRMAILRSREEDRSWRKADVWSATSATANGRHRRCSPLSTFLCDDLAFTRWMSLHE